ncbi:hypothetical protein AAC387_Pa07g2225 [Persea americana]
MFRTVVDYAATMDKDVALSWAARAQLGLRGEAQDMVARIERALERAVRRKTPTDKLSMSISKKLAKFNAAFKTNWENFSFNGCSSS